MKKIVLTSLLALFLAFPVFAQDEAEDVTLPDAVMEQLVRRIVTWYFKPSSRPKIIYLSERNIKKEWLPTITNIKFVLLPESSAEETEGTYIFSGNIYFFDRVGKEGRRFSITFGIGDPTCNSYGDVWYFRVIRNRVRLSTNTGQFGSNCSRNTLRATPKQ